MFAYKIYRPTNIAQTSQQTQKKQNKRDLLSVKIKLDQIL